MYIIPFLFRWIRPGVLGFTRSMEREAQGVSPKKAEGFS